LKIRVSLTEQNDYQIAVVLVFLATTYQEELQMSDFLLSEAMNEYPDLIENT
jgi:hypothetical protein